MPRLSLDALQVLDAIARRGSFAAAAEEIHRTTSTLSYTVRKLEQDLGVRVFDRSGHRAALTEHGRLLIEEGRALLDAAAAVERRVRGLAGGWESAISIAVNELLPLQRVLGVVKDFYAQGRPTRVRLSAEILGGAWDALIHHRAEIAITEVPGGGAVDVAHRPLGEVSFVFAVAPDHPLAAEAEPLRVSAIRRHRVVVAADSSRNSAPRATGIASAADVLTVSSLAAKVEAQVAGLGVGFLPSTLAAPLVEQGRLLARRVSAPKPRQLVSVAWRSEGAGPATRWFAERLQRIAL